ncbi:helix-turn-helix domain-containing protein [Zavarzinia sp. CC-PAN008]|uniref:helix-turn-helix domain-containing protein n=1 Tax=Zavarzinia sp. CC-PAN008 TaxID=3243332 RepID=UPI003F74231A
MSAKKSRRFGRFHDTEAAQFLRDRIDAMAPTTQREIAVAAGFTAENVLSMIKFGEQKVPLERVEALARALGVEPHHLMRMALAQYTDGKREAFDRAFASFVSIDEEHCVAAIRQAFAPAPVRASPGLLEAIERGTRNYLTNR